MNIKPDTMKEILRTMFEGWKLRENSWNPRTNTYRLTPEEAAEKVCGGDKRVAELLSLFSYWDNDIVSVAAHLGIGFSPTGDVIEIPPPPNHENYYWHNNQWNYYEYKDKTVEGSET